VVRIRPGRIHGEANVVEKALIVTVEKVVHVVGHLHLEAAHALVKEDHDGEHATRFCSEGSRIQAKARSHAFPEDVSADGEFPTKGSSVCFGSAIAD
jgi:hypothetical protein